MNPRIAREFLLRTQANLGGNTDGGVTFQSSGEEFSQWKRDEELAARAEEVSEERPTTFAEALLSKLNIADGADKSDGSKGMEKTTVLMPFIREGENQSEQHKSRSNEASAGSQSLRWA